MLGRRKNARSDDGLSLFAEALAEAGSDVYLLVRADDWYPVFVSGNFERMFLLPPERIQDDIEVLYRLLDPETRRSIKRLIGAWDGRDRIWFDFPFTPDGTVQQRAVRCTVSRVLGGSCYLASFSDVSIEQQRIGELRDHVRELSTDAQVKTDFLNKMSHEIRTPLNGIVGLLELARTHGDDPVEVERDLAEAAELGRFLMTLVNDILDMSRLEAGKVELELHPFDLSTLADDVRSIFFRTAADRGITLRSELQDCEDRFVVGDRLRLSQIVVNLVSNALKFTPEGGLVTVTFRQMYRADGKGRYLVRVRDTGKGIDPQFLGRIFRPFEQEDGSIAPSFGGSGLGMAIADSLAKLMGGEIVIDSEVGRGTDVSLYLPFALSTESEVALARGSAETERWVAERTERAERIGQARRVDAGEAPAPARNASAPADDAASSLAGMRLLVAEDNDVNARITVSLLKLRGVEVQRVRDGAEALERFEQSDAGCFDAVLMDIKMPGMDGWEAARRIRESGHPDAQDIVLVALSANAYAEDARRSLEVGMDGHIGKPIDFDELEALLERARSARTGKARI